MRREIDGVVQENVAQPFEVVRVRVFIEEGTRRGPWFKHEMYGRSMSPRWKANRIAPRTAAMRQAAAFRASLIGARVFEPQRSCPRKIPRVATSYAVPC